MFVSVFIYVKKVITKFRLFSKVTDVPQMSFFWNLPKQEIAHAHKIGCYSMARNYGTAIRSFKKQYTHLQIVIRPIIRCVFIWNLASVSFRYAESSTTDYVFPLITSLNEKNKKPGYVLLRTRGITSQIKASLL